MTTKHRITVQIFRNGEALGEGHATLEAESEQAAVDEIFRHVRIDQRYRFLGHNGFITPTGESDSYLLWNGGKA